MIGRCIRRLALLAALAAAGAVLFTKLRSSRPAAAPSPSWPPFEPSQSATNAAAATPSATPVAESDVQSFAAAVAPDTAATPDAAVTPDTAVTPDAAATPDTPAAPEASGVQATDEPSSGQRWVAPVDGQCPEGYPIKANDNSGIFHVPGGRFYARTVPERCYAAAEDAAADGYRQAKA